ncbi:MAG: CBS domain-containing protein [Gammaproteobacteria bacterium]
MMMLPIDSLYSRNPLALPPDTSLQDTAQAMSERRVSSVLIMVDDRLDGIVTDRDLRTRALARAWRRTPDRPHHDLQPAADRRQRHPVRRHPADDQSGVHHLPVVQAARWWGSSPRRI